MDTTNPTCRGTKKDGAPCGVKIGLSADGLCLTHDPARAEEAKAVRVAGGRAAGAARRERAAAAIPDDIPPPPKNLEDAVRYFAWVAHAIASGRLDNKSGHDCAYALNGFKAAVEKRDLERQIKALRKELAEARSRPMRVS